MPSFLAVIDGSIDPELILHESTFLGAAGDADRSRASDLGELADQQLRQDDLFHCSSESAICLFKHRFLPPQLFFSY